MDEKTKRKRDKEEVEKEEELIWLKTDNIIKQITNKQT
jgi:hypothetical protein